MSKTIICVGRKRTGKTTFTKENFLKKVSKDKIMVYDVNNEYTEFYNSPFLVFDEYLEKCKNEKCKMMVFEEATIFFKHNSSQKVITDLLVKNRHTKNFIILNFHSFRTIPKYILEMATHLVIFKTNDSLKIVKNVTDNENIITVWSEIMEDKNQYANEIIDLYEV